MDRDGHRDGDRHTDTDTDKNTHKHKHTETNTQTQAHEHTLWGSACYANVRAPRGVALWLSCAFAAVSFSFALPASLSASLAASLAVLCFVPRWHSASPLPSFPRAHLPPHGCCWCFSPLHLSPPAPLLPSFHCRSSFSFNRRNLTNSIAGFHNLSTPLFFFFLFVPFNSISSLDLDQG